VDGPSRGCAAKNDEGAFSGNQIPVAGCDLIDRIDPIDGQREKLLHKVLRAGS